MFEYIIGKITEKYPDHIVVENNQIGYSINISLSTFEKLKINEERKIYIYYYHREDIVELFGFYDLIEKKIFKKLIKTSGIGPKLAIKILSKSNPEELIINIKNKNISLLTTLPGLGKKTAQKLILELSEKLDDFNIKDNSSNITNQNFQIYEDAKAALINLGYKEKELTFVFNELKTKNLQSLENIIKQALVKLK